MEYLEGENVAGLVRRTIVVGRPLDPAISAYIIAEACAGLHAAHELTDAGGRSLELVHRDVSPQNIFVTYAGGVKVLDFGVAKAIDRSSHTEAGQLKGKFEYMSPEQCRGRPVDRRSDIFALGICLYEMVTRKRLFKRDSRLATLEAIWRDTLVPPSKLTPCPPEIERIILKALQKSPDDRFQTAAEMRRELMAAVHQMLPGVLPEESLAGLMGEIFEDRIDSKREMLNRARSGANVDVPTAEVDSGVEIPEVEAKDRSRVETGYSIGSSSGDAYALERTRRRRRLALSSAAATIAVLVALFALWIARERPAEQRLRAVARSIPRAALPAPPQPEKNVVISISSVPTGATVVLGEEDKGKTPLELALPRGNEALALTIRKTGWKDATERVTPDVNQRLRVMLIAERVPVRRGGKTQTGFRRFD
jgi:serine/threonine-protein kinase